MTKNGISIKKGANINYRSLTSETGIDPTTGKPDSVQILGTDDESEGVMNTPDYPFGIDHNEDKSDVNTKTGL